jgi:hypothetical protein
MALVQLVPLVMPRNLEGAPPILPPTTQCLAVKMGNNQDHDVATTPSLEYGDTWQAVSNIPILKEASCTDWYWTMPIAKDDNQHKTGASNSVSHGPGNCRQLLKAWDLSERNSSMMVFAQSITEKWTCIVDLPHLQHVLEILQNQQQHDIQDELEAFLQGVSGSVTHQKDDDSDADYQSDGGTRYVKDPRTGNFVHEALVPPQATEGRNGDSTSKHPPNGRIPKKKSKKQSNFKKSNAKHWIYVSGLPTDDVTEQDVAKYFGKAGLIELDPLTLQPKIKLYRDKTTGQFKGDASICYAHTTSVDLALQVLDESWWDGKHQLHVERAVFEAKPDRPKRPQAPISQAQRKVARLALKQAQDEGLGDVGRLAGGRKGLRIIVVKHLLEPLSGKSSEQLEKELDGIFAKFGDIEKMTAITETNVVIVKYVEPVAASEAMEQLNGTTHGDNANNKLEAIYWDGVTDYTTKGADYDQEQKEEEQRHEEFGKWLETSQEELPPELQLQVAGEGND